jgi:hypothetical protein
MQVSNRSRGCHCDCLHYSLLVFQFIYSMFCSCCSAHAVLLDRAYTGSRFLFLFIFYSCVRLGRSKSGGLALTPAPVLLGVHGTGSRVLSRFTLFGC